MSGPARVGDELAETGVGRRLGITDDAAWAALLREIIDLGAEEHNLRVVLRRVAELVVAATRADACFVHVVERDAAEVVLMGATPAEFEPMVGSVRLPHRRRGRRLGRPARAARARRRQMEGPALPVHPGAARGGLQLARFGPTLRPHGVVGALNVHARQPRHFDDQDVDRLNNVASLLAGIVENAVLYDRLVIARRSSSGSRHARSSCRSSIGAASPPTSMTASASGSSAPGTT